MMNMMYQNNNQEKEHGCFFILIVIAALCFFGWLIWAILSSPEKKEPTPDSLATEMQEDSIKADTTGADIFDVVESDDADEDKKSEESPTGGSSRHIKSVPDLRPTPISGINSELMKDIERTISRGKQLESQVKSLIREQPYDVKSANINIGKRNVNIDNTTETVTSEPASVPEETPVTE